MSKPEAESTSGEGTWTETIHHAITEASGAVHRAVNVISEYTSESGEKNAPTGSTSSTTHPASHGTTTTSSAPHPAAGDTPSTTTHTGSSDSKRDAEPESSKWEPKSSAAGVPPSPQPGQSASPTLTDKPSSTFTPQSDPSPSGPTTGGTDSSRSQSKNPSSSLPPPQSSGPSSATARGDAPEKTADKSASSQRQVNKGDEKTSTSGDGAKSGPVSMSGQDTSHPGAGATPASGAGAPVGDPSSGQADKGEKQGGATPLKQPPKSKEDEQDPGTGQKYVKSSGVAAEGGDFDASKPGAGAEATRLLGKDGISLKDDQGKSTKPQEQKGEDTEKHGIGAKLKSAIHKE